MCLLRVMLKPPQVCCCLFTPLAPGERGKERGADGTLCLEQFWEAGVAVQPPKPGNHLGKCSRPPQREISLLVPQLWSMHSSVPRKQSHHSRRVFSVVRRDWLGQTTAMCCKTSCRAGHHAPHPCTRLLSLQLRRLCVLPGACAQINVSKEDANQSRYWNQPSFWGCGDVSTSPKVANTPLTLSPLWLSSHAFSSLVQPPRI